MDLQSLKDICATGAICIEEAQHLQEVRALLSSAQTYQSLPSTTNNLSQVPGLLDGPLLLDYTNSIICITLEEGETVAIKLH